MVNSTKRPRQELLKAQAAYKKYTNWDAKFAWLPRFVTNSDYRKLIWLKKYYVIHYAQISQYNSSKSNLCKHDTLYFREAESVLSMEDVTVMKLSNLGEIEINQHDNFTRDEVEEHMANHGWKVISDSIL